MDAPGHIPVLLHECLRFLAPALHETYLDCTAGLGGHAAAIAPQLAPGGTVILNDADPGNLARAAARVTDAAAGITIRTTTGNFAELPNRLPNFAPGGVRADVLLADLGFASTQVDDPARGFSFQTDGPLDMRLDPAISITAAELVNGLPEAELADLIDRYGEDRSARRIAAKLVRARAAQPIQTTSQLADLVRAASRSGGGGGGSKGAGKGSTIDPATRTFQALRIAVNDEIGSLEALLGAVKRDAERLAAGKDGAWLNPGARIGIISFHSLEDRPVKRAFEELVKSGAAEYASGTDGPVMATEDEQIRNPRSRSAKLRVIRLAAGRAG